MNVPAKKQMKTSSIHHLARTLVALCFLLGTAPLTLIYILYTKLRPRSSSVQRVDAGGSPLEEETVNLTRGGRKLRVLVTGAKMSKSSWTLRMLGKAGHDVWCAEVSTYYFNHTQFSKYCKGYKVLPRPEQDTKSWLKELRRLVDELQIDLLVPCTSPVESVYYAKLEEENFPCKIFFIQGETCEILDDKFRFAEFCRSNSLTVPETHHISKASQVEEIVNANPSKDYIIKPIDYDSVLRIDLKTINAETLPGLGEYMASRRISEKKPFVLQERLDASDEHGCFAIAWDGKLLAFTLFPSDPSCLVYETTEKGYADVLEFTRALSEKLNLTGMFCMDFLPNKDGKLLAIECNPRIHSGSVVLSKSSSVGNLISGENRNKLLLCRDVLARNEKYYWAFDQVMKKMGFWKSGINLPISEMFTQSWALWDDEDPWPFFGMYHVQVPSLLIQDLWNGEWEWTKIDFCIGKMVKVGGD